MKPAIEVHGLSKVYNISHRKEAEYITLRDTIVGLARKPLELVTGQKVDKEKFWALKDVNFTVQPGEVVGIIGRNGSGKSTLLKILSRIVEPTSGSITMRGKVASLLEVGTGFHPELTGRENIYFNGAILGMGKKEIERKFDEIVEFSEVEKFLDTPVKFYSSGMYVRLAFSVAAHLDPDILIVDEVLAVGDAAFQKKCLGKMRDVAGAGRTVLFVSHNMETVRQLCTRAIMFEDGQIKNVGSTTKVTNEYIDRHGQTKPVFSFEPSKKRVAQFAKIRLQNDSGEATSDLSAGEDWAIHLEYTIREPLKDTLITVEIQSDEYEVIYLTTDADQEKEIPNRQPGEYTAEVKFDSFHLNPGNYYLRIGLQAPGRTIHHEVADIAITVTPVPNDIRGTYFGGQYFGVISEKTHWDTTKLK